MKKHLDPNLVAFGKKLEALIKTKFNNQSEFAKAIDVTQATVSRYISGATQPSFKAMQRISHILDMQLTLDDLPVSTHGEHDTLSIPMFLSEVSAGKGLNNLDSSYDEIIFDKNWIQNQLALHNTNDIIAVKVNGDSMEPMISEGDMVIAKLYNNEPLSSQNIYILQYNDEYFIKKIQLKPNNTIKLISLNNIYDPIEINIGNNTENFQIFSTVVGKLSIKSFNRINLF